MINTKYTLLNITAKCGGSGQEGCNGHGDCLTIGEVYLLTTTVSGVDISYEKKKSPAWETNHVTMCSCHPGGYSYDTYLFMTRILLTKNLTLIFLTGYSGASCEYRKSMHTHAVFYYGPDKPSSYLPFTSPFLFLFQFCTVQDYARRETTR